MATVKKKGRATVCRDLSTPDSLFPSVETEAGGSLYQGSVSSRGSPLCTLDKQFLKVPEKEDGLCNSSAR